MSDQEAEGKEKQVKGKVREAAGVILNDKEMQAKGKMEKTKAKLKKK